MSNSVRLEFLPLAQLRTELDRIVPIHLFHWMTGSVHPVDGLFSLACRRKERRIVTRHTFIFGLGNHVNAQVNRLRQDDLVPRSFALDESLPVHVVAGIREGGVDLGL